MKKLTSLFLVIVMLALLVVPALAASGSVSLAASNTSLSRGDTFTVTATLNSSDAIAMGTVLLKYDSNVFEMASGTCHVTGANPAQVLPAQKVGTFMLGSPTVVSGKIFTFNMKVKDTAAFGDYTISSNASIGVSNGEPISSGSVKVSVVCSHSYGDWTQKDDTDHQQTCSICNDVKTENHAWDAGTVTTPATCKDPGQKTLTCSVCGATKTEEIPTTEDHSYGSWTKVDDNQHTHTCSVCGKSESADHNWDNGTVDKAATCKDPGQKTLSCTDCAATKIEVIPVTDEHSYGAWTKVDDNQHTHTCSICTKVETANHSWDNGTVTTPATCKAPGEKVITCTGCGATKTEVLPQLTTHTYDHGCDTDCNVCGLTRTTTHNYKSSWSKNSSSHWHECTECKAKKDSASHTPGAEPTETTAQTCTVCGYVLKAALGHTHSYAETWTTDETGHWHTCAGCEEKDGYADHDFENACDPDCSVCGYTRNAAHTYGTEWDTDQTNHWHTCTTCGLKADEAAHIPGPAATATTAQTCTACGFELAPALGEPTTEATEPSAEATEPSGTEPVDPEPTPSGNFPWWILLIVLILLLCIVVFLILRKKKH